MNTNLQIIARTGTPQQTVEISKPIGTSVAYIRCGWRRIAWKPVVYVAEGRERKVGKLNKTKFVFVIQLYTETPNEDDNDDDDDEKNLFNDPGFESVNTEKGS